MPRSPTLQRGFTYLWLLFILAAGAAGLAAIAQRTSVAVQREREVELQFRGNEIAHALSTYRASTPGPAKQLPTSLEELLDDRRGARPVRHLRRLYTDPFTGQADWVLVLTEDGRISGVHSRSDAVALRVVDLPAPNAGDVARVSSREFSYRPVAAASSADAATSVPRTSNPAAPPRGTQGADLGTPSPQA